MEADGGRRLLRATDIKQADVVCAPQAGNLTPGNYVIDRVYGDNEGGAGVDQRPSASAWSALALDKSRSGYGDRKRQLPQRKDDG